MIKVKLTDFTAVPGGRYGQQGEKSGEEFREKYVYPAYKTALSHNDKLLLDLDGCSVGVPTSFLEETVGGIVRIEKNKKIAEILNVKSKDNENLEKLAFKYIDDAYEALEK